MTTDLDAVTDVGELWDLLRQAKADDDPRLAAAVERRMREIAGHNDDRAHAYRDETATDPRVIVSPTEGPSGV